MNVADFFKLLQKSDSILSPKQARALEELLVEYPYFQTARALYIKALKNLDSYKFNNELKLTAAHTADREVLFNYMSSPVFEQHKIANAIIGRVSNLPEIEIVAEEVTPNPDTQTIFGDSSEAAPLPQNIKEAENILHPDLFEVKKNEKTSLAYQDKEEESLQDNINGKNKTAYEIPNTIDSDFTKNDEKHSFAKWLDIATRAKKEASESATTFRKNKKFALLDKFIENNPKIVPRNNVKPRIDISEATKINSNELMTETLAKVYLEQKKYKKALQAFKILSLKYPEKSSFFADQIRLIKKLQKEKG